MKEKVGKHESGIRNGFRRAKSMKGKKSARAQVTRERYRELAELGFVPHWDQSGRLWFTERDEYRRLVETEAIKPGASVQ